MAMKLVACSLRVRMDTPACSTAAPSAHSEPTSRSSSNKSVAAADTPFANAMHTIAKKLSARHRDSYHEIDSLKKAKPRSAAQIGLVLLMELETAMGSKARPFVRK